jgi:hemerythrin-like domain-containing protein
MLKEHELIGRVLDALDRFAAAAGGAPEGRAELGRFVRFIREYADERHHGKEERVLFEAMHHNGFPRDQGPVGMMVEEHRQLRELAAALARLAAPGGPWSPAEVQALEEAAASYTGTLREHIVKENEMLYPIAEEQLPPQVQEDVDRACADLDRRAAASGAEASLAELASGLLAARP